MILLVQILMMASTWKCRVLFLGIMNNVFQLYWTNLTLVKFNQNRIMVNTGLFSLSSFLKVVENPAFLKTLDKFEFSL